MWHLTKVLTPWVSPALLLVLLSACASDNPLQGQGQPPESPIFSGSSIEEPQNPAVAKPNSTPAEKSAPAASGQSATTARQRSLAAPPDAPRSASPAQPPAPIAKVNPSAGSDSLAPTFRTTERMAGFSADGRYFVHLESSRDTGAGIPKSSLQVVNVAANTCAQNACLETRFQESDADKPLSEAEKSLLQQTWDVRQRLKLTPPSTGTALAIVARDRNADGTETVTVRLNAKDTLQLRLRQKRIASALQGGNADRDQAAMQLEVTHKGQTRSLGSLNNYRDWVLDYSIRSVYLSPDEERVAVLLTALKPTFEGTLGTTIVQGFELSGDF